VRGVLGWLRGLLAVGLLAGFYVLAFVLVALDAVFVALALWSMFAAPSRAGSWSLVIGGSIPAVFSLLYGVATVSRAEQLPPGAVFLRRRDAPQLWRLVEDLAGELGTRPPTRIYLTPEVNASVSEQARMLGLAVGPRTMYIGVPLLTQLRPRELRAVLCHEFGHFAYRHTRFGAVTHRGAASLNSTLFRLRMTAQARRGITGQAWFFQLAIGAYARLYLRLSLAVRRRQELEADAHAAAVAGSAVTAEALRSVHALGHAWSGFLDTFVRPVQRLGFVPEDLFEAFAAMLDDPLVQRRLTGLRDHPVEPGRSRLDSHPPLPRRLALIEARPIAGPDRVDDDEPLLADQAPLRSVQRKILAQARSGATALPLAAWADLAAEALPIELARLLLDAARGAGRTARPTLGTVLDLLERGEQRRLAGTAEPGHLAEALYALVGQALVGAGLARWVFSWTAGHLLVGRVQTGRDLAELVEAAARDGSTVDALREDLARRGLAVEAPVRLARSTVAAPASRISGVSIHSQVPDFVADELARQRTVRTVTLVALLVLAVPWGIALIRSGGSTDYPPAGGNAPVWLPSPRALSPPGAGYLSVPPFAAPSFFAPSFFAPPFVAPFTFVVVARGDTLTAIACRYHTTVRALRDLNGMGSRTSLDAGETLMVPTGRGGSAEPGCG
jgi:Zn-dependent protease with chaperone function